MLVRLLIKDYENTASPSVQKAYAKLCSIVGILLNILLFIIKLSAGLISGSTAITADGFSNLFNALILFMLACSILVKLYMFIYNRTIANKINSSAMKATAADCISDMAATAAIVISLTIQHFAGWKIDGWCGLLVSAFIMFSGLKSMLEIVERLLGQSPDKDLVDRITALTMRYPEVKGINDLIIHDYGLGYYVVSMHIEGEDEGSSIVLNDIANEIAYGLYREMGCDTSIQTDF